MIFIAYIGEGWLGSYNDWCSDLCAFNIYDVVSNPLLNFFYTLWDLYAFNVDDTVLDSSLIFLNSL